MDRKELQAELQRLLDRATAIVAEVGENPFSDEQRTELDRIRARRADIEASLTAASEDDDRRRDISKMSDFMNLPQYRVPRGVGNGEDDSRKALFGAGWEQKGEWLFAPTSLGKLVSMYHQNVVWGELPDGKDPASAEASAYYKQVRAAFQPGYREAYAHYISLCAKMRSEGQAWSMLSRSEQNALSEGTDTAGGILVPPDSQAEILVRRAQRSIMRRYATVQPTSRDRIDWPRVQKNSTAADASIYSSGFVGSWVGETPAFTETDLEWGTMEIPIKKLRVATKLSNDFVSDSVANVLAFLTMNGAQNMALIEDKGFIAGVGAAFEPLGLLNSSPAIATVDVEGSTANTISNTTAAVGSAPKLIDLAYALPSQYLDGAVWLMRRAIEGDIRKLIDGQGRFHWPASGFGSTPRELLGYPVENTEFMPDDGTDANKVLFFGRLAEYIIGDRTQITTVVLRERFADTDQMGLILFERVGGAFWNEDAARIGVV